LAIPGVYLVLAGTWVALSDQLITDHVQDLRVIQRLEIEKDLAFVALTGLLLFAGIREALARIQAEARRRLDSEQALAGELRRLADRLAHAREEEQARIARDLHDDLGQLVTALTLTLRSSERLAAGLGSPELSELNKVSGQLARQIQGSIQHLASDLRPPALEHLDLGTALGRELRMLEAQAGWRATLAVEGGLGELPEPVVTALFRIGQEALTNVARHAEASAVRVRLLDRRDQFELRVQDNGRGITPSQVADAASVGLLGMRERAMQVGAEIDISGATGKGTIVTVRVRRRLPGARSSAVARPARNRSWR
jgi:signal transduction histidine kinase